MRSLSRAALTQMAGAERRRVQLRCRCSPPPFPHRLILAPVPSPPPGDINPTQAAHSSSISTLRVDSPGTQTCVPSTAPADQTGHTCTAQDIPQPSAAQPGPTASGPTRSHQGNISGHWARQTFPKAKSALQNSDESWHKLLCPAPHCMHPQQLLRRRAGPQTRPQGTLLPLEGLRCSAEPEELARLTVKSCHPRSPG